MELKLKTKEQEELILNNIKLVDYMLVQICPERKDDEDLKSIATIALVRAGIRYNSEKGKFSTYACKCIFNALITELKKKDVLDESISYDEYIETKEGIGSIIDATQVYSEQYDQITTEDKLADTIKILLNRFNKIDKVAYLYLMGGLKQTQIAQKFEMSQEEISRRFKRIREKIRTYYNSRFPYNDTFQVEIYRRELIIWFRSNNEKIINCIKGIQNENENSKMTCSVKENVLTIRVPLEEEGFLLLAKIMQVIGDFNLISTISKSSNYKKRRTRGHQIRYSRNLIASYLQDIELYSVFTIRDIVIEFPEINIQIIYHTLYDLKKDGVLTHISQGIYMRVK